MWVRSEYANELAVLSAWVAMLVPWSGATHTQTGQVLGAEVANDVLFVRFPLVEIQFRNPAVIESGDEIISAGPALDSAYPGTELFGDIFAVTPPASAAFYESSLRQASLLWTAAAVGFVLALALSLVLYAHEDRVVEALPVSPVRLMGALLGAGALGTAGASVFYYLGRDTAGVPIPVGVLVIGALAAVLLRTEQLDATEASPDGTGPPRAE